MTTPRRITTGILAAIALAISAAPASARPFDLNANGSYVPAGAPNPANGQSSAAIRPNPDEQTPTGATPHPTSATVRTGTASGPPLVVRVQAPANGFDWGDAGIGAAGGLAISMIGLGGALALSQHRARHNPA